MSDLLTTMDIQIHKRISIMKNRIARLKQQTSKTAYNIEDNVEEVVEEIEDRLKSGRERINAARKTIENWSWEKGGDIEHWLKNRKASKLRKEADRIEEYAEAAMDVALSAIDEAELALTRALVARSQADELYPETEDD